MIKIIAISLFILAFAGCSEDTANDTATREPVPSLELNPSSPIRPLARLPST